MRDDARKNKAAMKRRLSATMLCVSLCVCFSNEASYAREKAHSKPTSGVYGFTLVRPFRADGDLSYPDKEYDLVIKDASGKKILRNVRTKNGGRFTIDLPAGRYRIIPKNFHPANSPPGLYFYDKNGHYADENPTVTVWKGYHTLIQVFLSW